MHPRLKKCFQFGQYANLLFLLFAVICVIYYWLINRKGIELIPLEIAAYTVEVAGFAMMLFSLLNFWKIVRHRYIMKIAILVYWITEITIMILDFNASNFSFYDSTATALNIGHSIFSAVICFTYLALEPQNPSLEVSIVTSIAIILSGMLGVVFGMHVYVTLFANSIAYVVFFSRMRFLLSQERIMVDCHGDRARVTHIKSSFFDE